MSNVVEVQFTDKQIALDALKDLNVEGGMLIQTDRDGMYQIISFGLINPMMMIGLLQKAIKELLDEIDADESE
jgi:hypothetical protein